VTSGPQPRVGPNPNRGFHETGNFGLRASTERFRRRGLPCTRLNPEDSCAKRFCLLCACLLEVSAELKSGSVVQEL
jgi:hypothetical protein